MFKRLAAEWNLNIKNTKKSKKIYLIKYSTFKAIFIHYIGEISVVFCMKIK